MISTQNIFSEFNGSVKQVFRNNHWYICAPAYACIFMDEVKTDFLKRLKKICQDIFKKILYSKKI